MKSKDVEDTTKNMLKDFIYDILKYLKNLKINEFQNVLETKK